MSRGITVSSGVNCSICGFGIDMPGDHDLLLDLLMLPHDIIGWLSPRHRRRAKLWQAVVNRTGTYLDAGWEESEAHNLLFMEHYRDHQRALGLPVPGTLHGRGRPDRPPISNQITLHEGMHYHDHNTGITWRWFAGAWARIAFPDEP